MVNFQYNLYIFSHIVFNSHGVFNRVKMRIVLVGPILCVEFHLLILLLHVLQLHMNLFITLFVKAQCWI